MSLLRQNICLLMIVQFVFFDDRFSWRQCTRGSMSDCIPHYLKSNEAINVEAQPFSEVITLSPPCLRSDLQHGCTQFCWFHYR
jgi:hypothetical protein